MTAAAPTDRGGEPPGGTTALGAAAAADGGRYFFLGLCLAFTAMTLAIAIALTLALATEEHPSAVTAAYESSITPHRGHRGPLTSALCVRVTRTVARTPNPVSVPALPSTAWRVLHRHECEMVV